MKFSFVREGQFGRNLIIANGINLAFTHSSAKWFSSSARSKLNLAVTLKKAVQSPLPLSKAFNLYMCIISSYYPLLKSYRCVRYLVESMNAK